jgi:hypothetical protein
MRAACQSVYYRPSQDRGPTVRFAFVVSRFAFVVVDLPTKQSKRETQNEKRETFL